QHLSLGSTDAQRDWGYAPDYVRGMWLALQYKSAEDFVFATGKLHSVQDIVEIAFGAVGLDWKQYVKTDPRFMRPSEPAHLVGDASKARSLLGWATTKSFEEFIREMTLSEVAALKV
ncbi:MAG TPA: GDP-mannose 4,6-dehydratase, partial [Roseimicrobium sp.]|nr:GDP-mannose 4,6-dehydratase [Roseimicrobium sp.]